LENDRDGRPEPRDAEYTVGFSAFTRPKSLLILEMNPHRDLALSLFPPLVEAVSRDDATAALNERLEGWQFHECFGTGVDHPVADGRITPFFILDGMVKATDNTGRHAAKTRHRRANATYSEQLSSSV
jgi:hypothetical protein